METDIVKGGTHTVKKIMLLLLCVILALALSAQALGEAALRGYVKDKGYVYVEFGAYPQGENGEVEPILWRVLEVDGQRAYLLSEYVLMNNRVHPSDEEYIFFGGAFNRTEVFALLNGPYDEQLYAQGDVRAPGEQVWTQPFVEQAFTQEERAQLQSSEELGTVFLPAAEDINNADYGFTTPASRQGYGTPYALKDGGYGTDKSLTDGLFQYGNGSSPYWTRSQSKSYDYATRCTKVDGKLGYIRCVVMNEGLRPGVYLKLGGVRVAGGLGTKDAPYKIVF